MTGATMLEEAIKKELGSQIESIGFSHVPSWGDRLLTFEHEP